MSRTVGRVAFQATGMPILCVSSSRPKRGVRRPWGRRWAAGIPRSRGARRRSKLSVWGPGCVRTDRPRESRQPRGRRPPGETPGESEEHEASSTRGAVGSTAAPRDPESVWVNGAVGEPEVVGPAGSVWVTGAGAEGETECASPRGCERKGRPACLGRGGILELWLKVQAMRAATGCGEERVELCPMSAGEGPMERGVSGQASWVETSRRGLTGPWVKEQPRAYPRVAARASGMCGQGQVERNHGHAGGMLGAVQETGCRAAPNQGRRTTGVPGAGGRAVVAGVSRALEEEASRRGPGVLGREQPAQAPLAVGSESVYGNPSALWGRGQVVGAPYVVEPGSVGVPGLCQRRQAVEQVGYGGIPGLWNPGQPVGVPCVLQEEARYGGDPGFPERGQVVWVDTGSGGDPGSWGATQAAGVSGADEAGAGSGGPPGLWGTDQPMGGVPKTQTACGSVPGQWGTEQPMAVAPQAMAEETGYGGAQNLWSRQQALGPPPAEPVLGVVVGDEPCCGACCGQTLSQWERRPAMGEQGTLVPTALRMPGPVDQEAGCGDASCLCRSRQVGGLPGTVAIPEAASMYRYAPVGVLTAADVSAAEGLPAAVWVSGPAGQEASPQDVLNLWERVGTAQIPVASGLPEELWPVEADLGSRTYPGLWERRPVARVPGPLSVEPGSGGFPSSLGQRQTVQVPVAVGVPPAGAVPVTARWPRLVWEATGPRGDTGFWGGRGTTGIPTDATGLPTSARMAGALGAHTGSGDLSGLPGGILTGEVPVALHTATMVPGLGREDAHSGGLLCLSGRRQTSGIPVSTRVSVPVGVPAAAGPLVGNTSSQDVSGMWGRRQVAEVPGAARVHSSSVEGEAGSNGVVSLCRRPIRSVPEAVQGPQSLGVLAAVGVPVPGQLPAAVWVTERSAEEMNEGASGLTVVRRESAEGPGALREEIEGRCVQASCGGESKIQGHPRPVGEETDSGNTPGVSTARVAVEGIPETAGQLPVPEGETGSDSVRGHPQQRVRRQAGRASGRRVRGSNLGENCVEEDRLRDTSQ